MKSTSLREVQRQTNRDYRNAIEELRRDPERGFQRLEEIGAVHEVPWNERAAVVAQTWENASGVQMDRTRAVLMVCATHDEIAKVTSAVREARKRVGKLGNAQQLARDVPLSWTAAQKSDWRNFRPGHVIVFHRAVKGIERNATAEVVRADSRGVVVRVAKGEERTLTRKQARSFEVFERRSIEVAAGDQLLFTANRRLPGFHATNGEIVTVDHFDDYGRIYLGDGRVVPQDYTHLAHGYAVTAHRSQGKSADEVIVSADGMSRELFYVAASRGRERVTIVTSDAGALRESVRAYCRPPVRDGAGAQSAASDGQRNPAGICGGLRFGEACPSAAARAWRAGIPSSGVGETTT